MDQGIYTSLIGVSGVTPAQIDAYVRSRNPEAPSLGEYYVRFGRVFQVRADIAAAQMVLETGFLRFGGQVRPEWHNPAGLKAASGEFLRFAGWEQGVHAHYERLNCYVRPYDTTGEGGKYDTNYGHWRYYYLMQHFGSADRLYDIAHLWTASSSAEDYAGAVWRLKEGLDAAGPGPVPGARPFPWLLVAGGVLVMGALAVYLFKRGW